MNFYHFYSWEPRIEESVPENVDINDIKIDEENKFFPYIVQAGQMAKLQLEDEDEEDEDEDDYKSTKSGFRTTMFIDFDNLLTYDTDLAEAVYLDFVRFESYLCQAVQAFVHDLHPKLKDTIGDTTTIPSKIVYFIAMYNLPTSVPLRELRTNDIGSLRFTSGRVTATTDVRPELLFGTFRCQKCGLMAKDIVQQFHFTRPVLCLNPRCDNKRHFLLEVENSTFCNWQRLRVQENSFEIPPGCPPRSMDVIVRNEMVELCKAGDTVNFVGSLVVVPNGSALARAGEVPQSSKDMRRRTPDEAGLGGGGGVKGLKALGVKELTYKTCFIATYALPVDVLARCTNQSLNSSTEAIANFLCDTRSTSNMTVSEYAMGMSAEEKEEIRMMKTSPDLYNKVS